MGGQRGNIVQNYPSVEYDFVPTILTATTSTYIHRQVSGSNTTPAGAGNGRESTDRSNFVQLASNDIGGNYVAYAKNVTQTGKVVDNDAALKEVQHWALLGQNDDQMDDAAAHQTSGSCATRPWLPPSLTVTARVGSTTCRPGTTTFPTAPTRARSSSPRPTEARTSPRPTSPRLP